MRHLRRSLIVLLIYLTVFYNIERLDFGKEDLINISTFVYGLNLSAMISILVLPPLWRAKVWVSLALWLVIFAVLRLFVFNTRPLFDDIYTYLLITEVALFTFSIFLSHRLARGLHNFEEAVKNMTFADIHRRLKKVEEAEAEIQMELHRSRRHQHPLTVMMVKPDPTSIQIVLNRTVQEVQQAMMTRYALTSLARLITDQLRRTDLVLDQLDRGRFVIVSYDTDATRALALAERIQAVAHQQLGVKVACGLAAFPNEALTFEELMHKAEDVLRAPALVVVKPAPPTTHTWDSVKTT